MTTKSLIHRNSHFCVTVLVSLTTETCQLSSVADSRLSSPKLITCSARSTIKMLTVHFLVLPGVAVSGLDSYMINAGCLNERKKADYSFENAKSLNEGLFVKTSRNHDLRLLINRCCENNKVSEHWHLHDFNIFCTTLRIFRHLALISNCHFKCL
jgi:hypothetical protein